MNFEKWLQLNNQTAGRDKLARLLQYFCRAVWNSLESARFSPDIVENFKSLEYILSTFRKLLRFGRCVDTFHGCLKSIHYHNIGVRITLTISKLANSLYLLSDHFLMLARTGLFKSIDTRKWAIQANKYWLLSITMNLCRDFIELCDLEKLYHSLIKPSIRQCNAKLHSKNLHHMKVEDYKYLFLHSYQMMLSKKPVLADILRNLCDLFIPLTGLGYTSLTPRTIGLLGVISSAISLMVLMNERMKLHPS